MNRERPSLTRSAVDKVKIEDKFKDLKRHVAAFKSARDNIANFEKFTPNCGDIFAKAWSPLPKRFKFVASFCNGLSTVFLGTATV